LSFLFVGTDSRTNLIVTLMAVGWLAGLLSVVMLFGLLRRVVRRAWVAHVVTVGFIASQGFLNFAQSGCSYVPGLALLLTGMNQLVAGGEQQSPPSWRSWAAGLALCGAAGLWFPFVFSIPAVLASPIFIYGYTKSRGRFVLQT